MKYIILLVLLFALPFIPVWWQRLKQIDKKASERRVKIEEAFKILELPATATDEEIKAAHRRLMQKNHPDAGGSEYFASKINEARDILLSQKS